MSSDMIVPAPWWEGRDDTMSEPDLSNAMDAAKKLLQRDVPNDALPYFEALRKLLWAVESEHDLSRRLADFGEKTGASPWT